jgi:hypothetical protein
LGRLPSLLALVPMALGLLAGCGSASATHSSTTASNASASLTGKTANTAAHSSTTLSTPTNCAATVAGTLGTVAARIYREAATGGDVAQATGRVQSSSALVNAIDSDDSSAANAALRELLLGQIVRVEVIRDGRVFARAGSGTAIAPVHGAIPGTNATFMLSTQADHSYLEVVHQVTGAQVLLISGGRRLDGTTAGPSPANLPAAGPLSYGGQSYQTTTIIGAVYPTGALRIVLLVPTAGLTCPGTRAQTRVETLGKVGELIYQEELHSPDVEKTVRHIESSPTFQQAVATRNPAATREAIVGFFREHIHVVRVRVTTSAGLLVDVGGPYVLAPVKGTVRSGGKTVGQFEMAIQDDAGYLKLAHLFTGAEVLMRTGERQVMGTLTPGPASVPDRGQVSYEGRTYEAYSFIGTAFPEGPLRISLLLAS